MADAKANKSVYARMSAKLGSPDNGSGMIKPSDNKPGGTYSRKTADTSNGKANYKRKNSGATAANTVNDGYQTKAKAIPLNSGKNSAKTARFAD